MVPMLSALGAGRRRPWKLVAASRAPSKQLRGWIRSGSWEAMGEAEDGRTPGFSRRRIKTGRRTRAGGTLLRYRGCGGVISWARATRPKPSKPSIAF
jgi:hypothetical protein